MQPVQHTVIYMIHSFHVKYLVIGYSSSLCSSTSISSSSLLKLRFYTRKYTSTLKMGRGWRGFAEKVRNTRWNQVALKV